MNLVGTLGGQKSKFPSSFHERLEKQMKNYGKNGNFYGKPIFDKIDFGFWYNSKINDRRDMKF